MPHDGIGRIDAGAVIQILEMRIGIDFAQDGSIIFSEKDIHTCEIQIQSLMDNSPVLEDVEEGDIIGWDDEPTEG